MKKLLLVTAVLALSSSFAFAAEDKGTEFKFGGEFRTRYTLDNNPTYMDSKGVTESHFQQRTKFNVNAITGDKLQAYVGLLHYSLWGANNAVPGQGGAYSAATAGSPNPVGIPGSGNTTNNNALQVNEAWMWWKAGDNFSIKAGRQGVEYGDGLVFSKNDWQAIPYSTDALMGRFGWDFMDLDLGGGKFAELGVPNALTPNNIASTTVAISNTDTEINFFGLLAGFKNLPEFLKKVELFVLQVNSDIATTSTFIPGASTTAGAGGYGLTSYGLHAKGETAMIDYRLDGVMQTGKQKNGATATSDMTFSGYMMDAEIGANFAEFMKARVYVNYHMDTGDDNSTADKMEMYQPLFYDTHRSGLMNVFGWGNATQIQAGLHLKPSDATTVGLDFLLASRTSDKQAGTVNSANFGNYTLAPTPSNTLSSSTPANSEKALGTEIDLWADHAYGNGFSMLAGLGYVMPGAYYKPAAAAGTTAPSVGSAMQFVAQAKYMF